MRILVISHAYRPSLNPRAFRWTAITDHWAAQGHDVDVVCEPGHHTGPPQPGIGVHRVGRKIGAGELAGGGGEASREGLAKRAARGLWRAVRWPDHAATWVRPAKAEVRRLLRAHRYDLVISSSLPFSCHLAGLEAKRVSPSTRWIVDIGDPFGFSEGAPPNNIVLYGALNRRADRQALCTADAVSVTTEETEARYAQLFPELASRITVIPPLLSPAFRMAGGKGKGDGVLRLVYVGTLYGDIRNPGPVLAAFRALLGTSIGGRIELHFYGSERGCETHFAPYSDLMGKRIFRHGLVPQEEAAAALGEAAALVHIGNATAYQLPSKVVEYAAMARPIINFVSQPNDSSRRFFGQLEAVETVEASVATAPATVSRLASFLEGGAMPDAAERERLLASFSVPAIAERYLSL